MDNSTPDIFVLYLDQQLPPEEKQAFEREMTNNPAIKEQMDSLLATREAIRIYGLRQRIAGVHQQMMERMQPGTKKIHSISSSNRFTRYIIAAAAVLVILISSYVFFSQANPSPAKLFNSYYHPYELVTLRGQTNPESRSEIAYRQKDFNEVIRIHDAKEDQSPTADFLCGAAAMELKNYPKAIHCFNEVLDADARSGQPVYKDETDYYLALAYLQQHQYNEALTLLHAIQNDPAHTYRNEVSDKLVREVESLRRK